MTMFLSLPSLLKLWPHANATFCAAVASSGEAALTLAKINTPLRLEHFLAQVSHESSGGSHLEESLTYTTTARIMQVWPSRFKNATQAAPFVRQPRKLANEVYGGRMGNRPHTDDGWDYRGRGLIQITGRDTYAELGSHVGIDLLNHPELANDGEHALTVACAFWNSRPCNAAADADDLERVTRLINGGLHGLDERRIWLQKWKAELSQPPTG